MENYSPKLKFWEPSHNMHTFFFLSNCEFHKCSELEVLPENYYQLVIIILSAKCRLFVGSPCIIVANPQWYETKIFPIYHSTTQKYQHHHYHRNKKSPE